jgi:ribonuclease Z
MLEIVFLGTGCGIPSKRRNPASIWLNYEGDISLWDCGEGTQKQLMLSKLSFMKISRIFITHWHADHWAGLIGLMQTMNLERRRKPLHIYGPEAERFVSDILDLDYWGPRFKIIPKDVPFGGSRLTSVLKEKDYEVLSIPVSHTVPSVAYLFRERDVVNVDIKKAQALYGLKQGPLVGKLKEKGKITFKGREIRIDDVGYTKKGLRVVYTGDTKRCSNLEKISKDADVLIHDATFLDEKVNRMHSGVKGAAELAKKSGVKKLVLTHFSRRYQDTKPLLDEARKTFGETLIAEDFMRLEMKKKPSFDLRVIAKK